MTTDVVLTAADAAGLPAEPLLILEPLARCLDNLDIGKGEIEATRIGAGHSNATFALRRADGTRLVLRRPPRGPLPKGTHNVLREARVQQALAGQVPVPTILAAVDDAAVIGAPFYLMEHLDGTVLTSRLPAQLETPGEKERLAHLLIDGLADLHAVDWKAAGLADFARHEGYLDRQIEMWTEPGEPAGGLLDLQPFTRAGGFPTREALAERYAARTGRDVSGLAFYEVLTRYKGIVIFAGNRDRALDGSAPNAEVLSMSGGLDALIVETIALISGDTPGPPGCDPQG